jgi:hypothetical protein
MRIDSSGNVGIGTASPTTNVTISPSSTANGLDLAVDPGSAIRSGRIFFSNSTSGQAVSMRNEAGALLFATGATVGTSSGTERMRIDSSGNLLFNSGYGSVATAYGCRAWVNFNGAGTVAIRASGNVTSITDNNTGNYTVNFTNAMPDVNYSCVAAVINRDASFTHTSTVNSFATGSVVIRTAQSNSAAGSDYTIVCVSVFR